jgi:hypothetical protein
MSAQPFYSDLFAFGRHSIVWLRIYRPAGEEAVALALEPVDQPGAGPVNDAEALTAAIRRAFPDLGGLRVFVRFPDDPSEADNWIEILIGEDGGADFAHHPTTEVERLVAARLPDPGDPSCAGIGGPEHPLLALLPPDEPESDPLTELAVIAVADLPWPHNPFRCHWKDRFETLRDLYPAEDRERAMVGAHWFATLQPEELAACRYHQADWRRVAEVGVEILRGLDAEAVIEDALAAVEGRLGDSAEAGWCRSLFADPIICHREPVGLTDGQHRSCALRASGAAHFVVRPPTSRLTGPRAPPADHRHQDPPPVTGMARPARHR